MKKSLFMTEIAYIFALLLGLSQHAGGAWMPQSPEGQYPQTFSKTGNGYAGFQPTVRYQAQGVQMRGYTPVQGNQYPAFGQSANYPQNLQYQGYSVVPVAQPVQLAWAPVVPAPYSSVPATPSSVVPTPNSFTQATPVPSVPTSVVPAPPSLTCPSCPAPVPATICPAPVPSVTCPAPVPAVICPTCPAPVPARVCPAPVPAPSCPTCPAPAPSPTCPAPVVAPPCPAPVPAPACPAPVPAPICPAPVPAPTCPTCPAPSPTPPTPPAAVPALSCPAPVPAPTCPAPVPAPPCPVPAPSPATPVSSPVTPASTPAAPAPTPPAPAPPVVDPIAETKKKIMDVDNWQCSTNTDASGAAQACVVLGTSTSTATTVSTTRCDWLMPQFCDDAVNQVAQTMAITPPTVPAPPGYSPIPNQGNFKLHKELKTFTQAIAICESEGTHLSLPLYGTDNKPQLDMYTKAMPFGMTGFFVGITDNATEEYFQVAETGQPICQIGILSWQPAFHDLPTENVALIGFTQSEVLQDSPDVLTLPFMCQQKLPSRYKLLPCV